MRSPSPTTSAESVAWLALIGLLIWDLNDASGPKAVPNASFFLAVVVLIYSVAAFRRLGHQIVLPRVPVILVTACFVVGLVMIPFRPDFYLGYVMRDFGSLVFFLLCLVVAAMYRRELMTRRTVVWFVIGYSVIAVFAYFAAAADLRPDYWWNGRWDPPYYMLFAGLALLARYTSTVAQRVVMSVGLLVMLNLALLSGNRTQFLLGLVFVALSWASNHAMLYLMVLTSVTYAFCLQIGIFEFNPLAGLLEGSRFALLESGADDSLNGRFSEVHDIWYHLTVLNSPWQTLLGRGAGAVWFPITRYLEGAPAQVYYLHTGFSHMTYRYGLVGLSLFAYWVWVATRHVSIMFRADATIGEKFWYLGAFGFSFNFFLQNSLYDPPAVLAMAVLLVNLRQPSRLATATGDAAGTRQPIANRRNTGNTPARVREDQPSARSPVSAVTQERSE